MSGQQPVGVGSKTSFLAKEVVLCIMARYVNTTEDRYVPAFSGREPTK